MTSESADNVLRRRLFAYIKPNSRYLFVGVLCSLGVSAAALGVAFIMKNGLRSIELHHSASLGRVCAALVLLYGFRWLVSFGQNVFLAEVGQRIGLKLRHDIYAHLQSLSLSYFDRQRTGNLMSTMTNDVPVIQNGIMSIRDVVAAPVITLGGLITIFIVSWKLSLISILLLPPMLFAIKKITGKLRNISTETQNKLADVTTMTEETLAGIRLVRSFVAEKREIARFQAETLAAKNIAMRGIRRASSLNPTTDFIGALGIAIALWFGGYAVISGSLTFDNLALFVVMLDRVRVGASGFGSIATSWRQTQGAADRIFGNVLDVPTDVVESTSATTLPFVVGEVRFDGVCFGYSADRPVLKDISFAMKPGEVVAVVGHSGAGKSTLSDLIPRFYDPTSGAVLIDGCNIRDVTLDSLRRQIGIVPQETILFGGTVRENIAYGRPDAPIEQIEEAAQHANAHQFIKEMPNGYDTIVGERGVKLSGGQRQRIAIARALLKDPRILILDEATSSLDAQSEILVQEALQILMRGRTTLVIAHRLSTIQDADRIIVLDDGQIVEEGAHQELIQRGGTYARLYDASFRDVVDAPALLS